MDGSNNRSGQRVVNIKVNSIAQGWRGWMDRSNNRSGQRVVNIFAGRFISVYKYYSDIYQKKCRKTTLYM